MNSLTLEEQSQERLESMVDDAYITSAVLSAPNGKALVAAQQDNALQAQEVARMSQLLLAVADAGDSPRRNRIVCDVKGRPMIIQHAGPLILTVIGKMDANMGMIANIAEHSAKEMSAAIRFSEKKPATSGQFAFDADSFTQKVMADIEKRRQEGLG
jgi:hypothetical protein